MRHSFYRGRLSYIPESYKSLHILGKKWLSLLFKLRPGLWRCILSKQNNEFILHLLAGQILSFVMQRQRRTNPRPHERYAPGALTRLCTSIWYSWSSRFASSATMPLNPTVRCDLTKRSFNKCIHSFPSQQPPYETLKWRTRIVLLRSGGGKGATNSS